MDDDSKDKADGKKEESKKVEPKKAYGEPKLTKFGPVEELTGPFAS